MTEDPNRDHRPMTAPLPRPLAAEVVLPIPLDDPRIDTPAVLVDLDIVEANIARMAGLARRERLSLRPHVKTHKSTSIAQRQLAAGAVGVCCATASEAEVMIEGGVGDVLLAYPLVGRRKFERVAPLLGSTALTLVTDSKAVTASYRDLAQTIGHSIRVMIEIDSGMHRVGVDPRSVVEIAADIASGNDLELRGIMTHAGHSHDATDQLGIESVARHEAAIMGAAREELEGAGFDLAIVSAGSTITAPYLHAADGITEIRPGTYVYNDLRTMSTYACTPDGLAAFALATVVSLEGDRVTIDAGSKTLTTSHDAIYGFGHLRDQPGSRFTRLSEEHGVLAVPNGRSRLAVGDRVQILPIHVCAWMDLQPEIYGVRNGQIVERIPVEAMRHSL
jgi:D-serine deaminase-like pyridoxal phosphate-dependent protein